MISVNADGAVEVDGNAAGHLDASRVARAESLVHEVQVLGRVWGVPSYELRLADGVNGAQLKSVLQSADAAEWNVGSLDTPHGAVWFDLIRADKDGRSYYEISFSDIVRAFVVRSDSVELWRAAKSAVVADKPKPNVPPRVVPTERLAEVSADEIDTKLTPVLHSECQANDDCWHVLLFVAADAPVSIVSRVLSVLRETRPVDSASFVQLRMAEPPEANQAPELQSSATSPSGNLPPAVIQQIVRSHYDDFRRCYENGLARNSTLEGRVTVRFVIDRDGIVKMAKDEDSDMPDKEVVRCVVDGFHSLVFPKPDGTGIVTVVYPIQFSPG